MATIKSYTDISQSKKLAEILPIESADGGWYGTTNPYAANTHLWLGTKYSTRANFPAWSLAALISILSEYTLKSNKFYGKVALWCQGISVECDEPVDACVAMIEKLNELKML